ncbi:MAG: FMN-binding protein [Candidatus Omnitrophota bacterium]|nr:FMN-binding protein [Candidatus Omnitrophota bacterium]
MKEMVRYGFILSLICIAASASLAAVNSLTRLKIIEQARSEEEAGLIEVIPDAQKFEPIKLGEGTIYYKVFDKDNKFIGAAFKASQKGYSSTIETIVGMKKDGVITGIKVLSQNETPGLGARIIEANFSSQFLGKNTEGLSDVQTITGATISSSAVIESVKKKAEEIKKLLADLPINTLE